MDDSVRMDGERVKNLRKEKGWTQPRLALEIGSAGIGWLRKVEAGKRVRLEWNGTHGMVNAGEDLAAALNVDLDSLILDLLDGAKIKQFRDQRHWSSEQLARIAHVGVEAVERAETGQFLHRVETRAFAEAFSLAPADLLFVEQAKKLNHEPDDSWDHMQAGVAALCPIILERVTALGQPRPNQAELIKEAHGRIHFAVWKMANGAATVGSSGTLNSLYALALETAIGSELVGHTCSSRDIDIVFHTTAMGQDTLVRLVFALSDKLTAQFLSDAMKELGAGIDDWKAADTDLQTLCLVGSRALAAAINCTKSVKSENVTDDSALEAFARFDFSSVFVTRHHPYLTKPSTNKRGDFTRSVMLFVLGSHLAGISRRRLSFLDAVTIEDMVRERMSWARSRAESEWTE